VNLAPLLDAPIAIQVHVATVVPAALLGPWMFLAAKGTQTHRLLGKVWLGLMVAAAVSSFFIHTINLFLGFSPIHFLSVFVLYSSYKAIRAAQRHRIREHKINVVSMYVGGIIVAGGFTFLPGRTMHEIAFSFPAAWPDAVKLGMFLSIMAGFIVVLLLASHIAARLRPAARRVS
jgi:uncharacterized membrane protein